MNDFDRIKKERFEHPLANQDVGKLKLLSKWEQFLETQSDFVDTSFQGWPAADLRVMDRLHDYLFRFALSNGKQKEKALSDFDRDVGEAVFDFPITTQNFRIIPAESVEFRIERNRSGKHKGMVKVKFGPFGKKERTPLLWHCALILGQYIATNSKRFKSCPYCEVLFVDETTKAGSRHVCDNPFCYKKYNADRAKDSYKNRSKKKNRSSRKLRIKQKRKTNRYESTSST